MSTKPAPIHSHGELSSDSDPLSPSGSCSAGLGVTVGSIVAAGKGVWVGNAVSVTVGVAVEVASVASPIGVAVPVEVGVIVSPVLGSAVAEAVTEGLAVNSAGAVLVTGGAVAVGNAGTAVFVGVEGTAVAGSDGSDLVGSAVGGRPGILLGVMVGIVWFTGAALASAQPPAP